MSPTNNTGAICVYSTSSHAVDKISFNRINMYSKTVVVLLVACIVIATEAFPRQYGYGKEKPCVCMNWRNCDGEINSDVPCNQSYVFVCCIPSSRSSLGSDKQNYTVN
ncbi:hypothetical protein QE152_g1023 [Popillia japonica]|uniref:Uncharacterized protein n=1 Tax=Popillia japonica TaxID=7064 RepID=A0AAW1NCY1_POPJA